MARIHGRRGQLYVDPTGSAAASPVAYLSQWGLDFSTDRVDVTAFGDTNKTYVSGLPDAQGSFSGFYDTATAQLYTASQDGLARKFYLYPDNSSTGTYFFGTALFDFSLSGGVSDGVAVSGTFAAASEVAKVSA